MEEEGLQDDHRTWGGGAFSLSLSCIHMQVHMPSGIKNYNEGDITEVLGLL